MKKSNSIQIIKNRLYWISDSQTPNNIPKSFYFNIDNDLTYQPFNKDFGPLNLGKTYRYVIQLDKLLKNPQYQSNTIIHYTSIDYAKVANSVYLISAFCVIILGYNAEQAFQPFEDVELVPFRDASLGQWSYKCTVLDCLRGLEYAVKLGWFDIKNFDIKQYQHYERVQNGDLNWIIPGRLVAFRSPYNETVDKQGNKLFTPNDYVPIFKKIGVTAVVRLNQKIYQSSGFTDNGIEHYQLFFLDCAVPNMDIVNQFLQIAQKQQGAVAVHCKSGLGRTALLIACYAMKHYYFNARALIGWMRIVRPGSILGPYEKFLLQMDQIMKQKGKNSPIWKHVSENVLSKETVNKFKNLSIQQADMNQKEKQLYIYSHQRL